MKRWHVATLLAAVSQLSRAVIYVNRDPSDADAMDGLRDALLACKDLIAPLPVSHLVKEQLGRLLGRFEDGRAARQPAATITLVAEFLTGLHDDLDTHLAFIVPNDRRAMYLSPETWFGGAVSTCFPNAAEDVREACHCFAFGRCTATVFHAMRILEHGLRDLAVRLLPPAAGGFDLEEWNTLIERIEKAIRTLQGQPRSPEKTSDLQYYSEAAAQFRYFKDAWRNHVSHSRASYDEAGAAAILEHVRAFMRHLTIRHPEGGMGSS